MKTSTHNNRRKTLVILLTIACSIIITLTGVVYVLNNVSIPILTPVYWCAVTVYRVHFCDPYVNKMWKAPAYFSNPDALKFVRLIEKGNVSKIEKAIKNGADVNYQGRGNRTPLAWAMISSPEVFHALLEGGGNPNVYLPPERDGLKFYPDEPRYTPNKEDDVAFRYKKKFYELYFEWMTMSDVTEGTIFYNLCCNDSLALPLQEKSWYDFRQKIIDSLEHGADPNTYQDSVYAFDATYLSSPGFRRGKRLDPQLLDKFIEHGLDLSNQDPSLTPLQHFNWIFTKNFVLKDRFHCSPEEIKKHDEECKTAVEMMIKMIDVGASCVFNYDNGFYVSPDKSIYRCDIVLFVEQKRVAFETSPETYSETYKEAITKLYEKLKSCGADFPAARAALSELPIGRQANGMSCLSIPLEERPWLSNLVTGNKTKAK